ncbi:MAG TPA: chemotaxis protein CheB, partial [Bryobacteraceae bacterium]|nr:chemotaxis protein CheB [Bryobacteraceae bacterium]
MPKNPKKPTGPSPVQNSEEEPPAEPLALELIDDDRPAAGSFPVVGVGASAGGLEAFTQLLHALPPDTGMAFVFIQHLDPKHVSMLRQLLSRETSMGVSEAVHQSLVEPNHVYVIPQNTCMSIRSNRLLLEPRSGRHHMPVNSFLQSLAVEMKSKAIGVILSGTGSDGTVGLKAVKAGGGISFAQEPVWAKFPGMPRSAIAARCVDFILPPDGIAKELAQLGRHPYVHRPELVEAEPTHGNAISRILAQLRIGAGVDFTRYKTSTIRRRIARRMVVHKLERPEHYADLLRTNPAELTELYEDILINVTQFFRDPETFNALQRDVFPQILAHQEVQVPIRIWVPGCSTGEEVYSIAIALMEHLGPNAEHVSAQIFGTDISDMALDTA